MWNRTENQISVILIRHGATPSNREHRYLGRTEESLSEEGKARLCQDQQAGRYPEPDRLFISPMERCIQTAEILYPGMEAARIPQWKEMDFGDFEGYSWKELTGDVRYQNWIDSGGTLPFPGGESRDQFCLRCLEGWKQMWERVAAENRQRTKEIQKLGIIAHGGTLMALLSSLCGGDYFDYQTDNGGGYCCSVEQSDSGYGIRDWERI